MPGNATWCQSVNGKTAIPESSARQSEHDEGLPNHALEPERHWGSKKVSGAPAAVRFKLATLQTLLQEVSIRGRLVAWLLTFISAYRLGMPILFSAALSGLPWLLLPSDPVQPETPLSVGDRTDQNVGAD